MGQFSASIAEFVAKTKEDADQACRAIGLELVTRIVLKSPVGNPELWQANQGAVRGRETFNLFVDLLNSQDAATGAKRKPLRRKGQRALAKQFPLRAGKGYVGGTFRRNWQVSIGSPKTNTIEAVDPSGSIAIADAAAVLSTFQAGPAIFLANNLPYSLRLEMGYSTQAPAGVVRVTLAEFPGIVQQAVAEASTQ